MKISTGYDKTPLNLLVWILFYLLSNFYKITRKKGLDNRLFSHTSNSECNLIEISMIHIDGV